MAQNGSGSPRASAEGSSPLSLPLPRWACSPLTIFAVALLARVAWVLTLPNELIWIDEKQFAEIAHHLVAGEGYISGSYRANPVVPTYLASFFYLFGNSLVYPRLGQAVIGALTCVLVQRLGTVIGGAAVGTIAAFLVTLYPGHIYLSGVFYVDCIAIFFACGWLIATYHTMSARHPLLAAAVGGVLFALVALTRPTFLGVAPLAAAAFFLLPGARVAPAFRIALVFTLACVLTIAPWTYRNYQRYGCLVVVAGGFWDTLWKGNSELSDGGPNDRHLSWDTALWYERLAKLPQAEQEAIVAKYDRVQRRLLKVRHWHHDAMLGRDILLKPIVIRLIVDDPGRFATLFVRKVMLLFNAFSATADSGARSSGWMKTIVALYYYPLLALASAALVLTAREWRRFAPVTLIIVGWAVLHGVLTSCTRFRLPIDPFLFILSATAIARLLAIWLPRPARAGD